ncbi:MAG: hypothetical protein COA43_08780 [Robiginitomaculum sp.]|nr:MAG: hypothetical protein COA43_08780 [Robiginitomaculum sp.]
MSLHSRAKLMSLMAIGYGIFAFFWALAPYTPINLPARFILDLLDWPLNNLGQELSPYTQWLSSIGAGLLAALAVMLGGIIAPALKRGDTPTIRVGFWAMVIWYVIDSAGSIASGIPSNAAFNTLFVAPALFAMMGAKSTS